MTFINIIYKLPHPIKKLYRNIERNQNKITKIFGQLNLMEFA